MIDSYTATSVIVGFLIIFGVLLPIVDKIPKIRSIVSFRWTVVVIYSAMCLGVIIDFEHLDTEVRFLVVLGGIILSSIFLFVRSYEKASVNDWKIPHVRSSLQKGDIQAELSVSSKINKDLEKTLEDTKINNKLKYEKEKNKRKKEISKLLNSCVVEEDDSALLSQAVNKTEKGE